MKFLDRFKAKAAELKRDLVALTLAYRDARTPWYAKAFAALVVAYAISPIDLVPDFIPVLGYLDDLVLIPAGIAVSIRLIPKEVMVDARNRAAAQEGGKKTPLGYLGTALIVLVWLALLALAARIILPVILNNQPF